MSRGGYFERVVTSKCPATEPVVWHIHRVAGDKLDSQDPYSNPELFRFTGSMEGVPDFLDLAETQAERAARTGWRAQGHSGFDVAGQLAPGVLLASLLAIFGSFVSDGLSEGLPGVGSVPVSPILVAILGGLVVRNTIGLPSVFERGLQLCMKRILRVGVALLGMQLSLIAVGEIGLLALPLVVLCIGSALLIVRAVSRVLDLPDRLGTLIAVGTAICGNTAIVATAPVVGASEEETSYAVGTITVFGLLALVVYPFLSHALFSGDGFAAGIFLGTAIHDTAQVAGAALLYSQQFASPETLETATVTKLLRNALMVAVIPLVAWQHKRQSAGTVSSRRPILEMVPLFVLGFLALAAFRTLGDLGSEPFAGIFSSHQWQALIALSADVSIACLAVAMAAVGLGTHLARLSVLGVRPLVAGLVAAATVGGVSAIAIYWMGSVFGVQG